ncbi:MAG: hypothetical protein ACODAE_05070 [Gemmatimonadota bacterium]
MTAKRTTGCEREVMRMARDEARRKLEEKREEMRRKGKPDHIGKPRETDRELVEEGERKRSGTNLDIDEARSDEQQREARRWRRE